MYFFITLLVVFYLAAPVILIVMLRGMRDRVELLDTTLRAIDARLARLGAPLAQADGPLPDAVPEAALPPAALAAPETPAQTLAMPEPDRETEPAPAEPEASEQPEAPEQPETPRPPRDYADLEKRFGTQWVVWIGGIALALGGIFLVRYSIEQGLFGPGLRIALGALLALVLAGLGEIARRREIVTGLAEAQSAHIPSILTAAGTTVAYADVWAAHALYGFLSPGLAFALLGIVALATLAAALVHGPALGGLGLVGAYVTPALVGAAEPNYWALYLYLAVVTAAAYALARARLWPWLAVTAAAFSVFWMFAGIGVPGTVTPHAFHALAGFALASVFVVAGLLYGPPAEPGRIDRISSGVLAGYLFGAFMLVLASHHDTLSLLALLALVAATAAVAWRTEAALAALPAAASFALLTILHWVSFERLEHLYLPGGALESLPPLAGTEGFDLHIGFALATAALFGAGGYLAQGRSRQPAFPILWAATGVVSVIVVLAALYYRVAEFERSWPFAAAALSIAAGFGVMADRLARRDPRPGSAGAAAIFACGGIAALALAFTFALEKGWLTVALALTVPGVAAIADRRPLPMLRQVCGILTALVLVRVAWDPRIVGDDVGTTPVFNWILYGYGIPALCFWAAGHLLRRRGDDMPARSVDAAAILFTVLVAMLEVRHLMNDGDIYRPLVRLGEIGLQISAGLALLIGLEHLRQRSGSIVHELAANIVGVFTFAAIVVGLGILCNPMLTGENVGGAFFNFILLGYGFPAVLMGILARKLRATRERGIYLGAAVTAIVLMLAYLTLQVRTLYHGPVLVTGFVTDAEDYTYSAVWLAFGVALLLAGIALQSQPARFASAAVVTLTIAKVFLHDLAGVQGIYRAFSFICLGLVLMGIGWLYQRLLFPPRRAGDGAAEGAATRSRSQWISDDSL